MLLSAGIELPKEILIHSFITSGGEKMSKTLGNVIDPFEMIEKYGLEPFRYYLLSQIPLDADGDFTEERFKDVYTAELSNGLGNLTSRVAKLCENNKISAAELPKEFDSEIRKYLDVYQLSHALSYIKDAITEVDKKINEDKPWALTGDKAGEVLNDLVIKIQHIAFNLQPFMPETAQKILTQFSGEIKSGAPLFPRIQNA